MARLPSDCANFFVGGGDDSMIMAREICILTVTSTLYNSLEELSERLLHKGVSKIIAGTSTLLFCSKGRPRIIA
jgi:hypothetical protein